jgi:Rrf2 family transcriptional regulator, iron-sulfur cluster assembly transcription factor
MAILSKSCIYGTQAAIYIASLPRNEYTSIRVVAEKLNISFHFLTKVLQILTQEGLMLSYRGPNGGIALARPPSSITLADIITAIDGHELFTECLLGLPGCGKAAHCPAHEQWMAMRNKLLSICKATTLQELAAKANELNVRLALPLEFGAK